MINNLTIIITVILVLSASCSTNTEEDQLPENAFPIVYRSHIYISGEVDSIKGNYVFDTGASGLYFDTTFYSSNSFHYSKPKNRKQN